MSLLEKIQELSPDLKERLANIQDIDGLKSFLHDHGIDLSEEETTEALDFLKKGMQSVLNGEGVEGVKDAIADVAGHKGHGIFKKILDKIHHKG